MRPFNLAESRIAERAICRDLFSRRLRVTAMLIALTVIVAAVSSACKMSVRNQASRLTSGLADVQGRCAQVKREIAQVKAKANQREWQKQLADGSRRWLGVMDSVLARVPPDVWLSKMESSDQNMQVTVEGQAASFASLSDFTSSVRTSSSFSEVRISNTRTTVLHGAAVVEFAVQIKLKTPAGTAAPSSSPQQPQEVPRVQESG